MRPNKIWAEVKEAMDKKHTVWVGSKKQYITDRVRRTRSEMNHGDIFRTIENSPLGMMTDTNRAFLQNHSIIPDTKNPGEWKRIMVFGNPTLFGSLNAGPVDAYVDATFDCCPFPFYQCLIFMIFHRETNCYLSLSYILMSHKLPTWPNWTHQICVQFKLSNKLDNLIGKKLILTTA